ncbi:hypothetical protein X946_5503 [Burkholderia sp. ABCPW 111]|nr:hypothetical protein X946_5503 [Burkholderia sp. ABCPW 111]
MYGVEVVACRHDSERRASAAIRHPPAPPRPRERRMGIVRMSDAAPVSHSRKNRRPPPC